MRLDSCGIAIGCIGGEKGIGRARHLDEHLLNEQPWSHVVKNAITSIQIEDPGDQPAWLLESANFL